MTFAWHSVTKTPPTCHASISQHGFLACGNVLASERGISELDRGRQMQHVPKSGVDSIALRHGCPSHRPLLELILGLVFVLIGLRGVYILLSNFGALRYDLMFLFLGAVGGTMVFDVMRRRYFLEIASRNKTTKIVFSKETDVAEIREFCSQMEHKWKYSVKVCI